MIKCDVCGSNVKFVTCLTDWFTGETKHACDICILKIANGIRRDVTITRAINKLNKEDLNNEHSNN